MFSFNVSEGANGTSQYNNFTSELWENISNLSQLRWILAAILISFSMTTVIGNGLVVAAVIREPHLHTPTNYFITSLAIADLLVGLLVMPFSVFYEVFEHKWLFGLDWCDIWRSLDVFLSTSSILHLCAISLDRYLAITDPIQYPIRMSHSRARKLIAFIWICSMIISFPAIIWWRYVRTESVPIDKCPFTNDTGYILSSSVFSFYGPLVVMVFTYLKIYQAAMEQTRSLKLGTKQVMMNFTRGEMEMTLRIHRGRGADDNNDRENSDEAEDDAQPNAGARQSASSLGTGNVGKNFSISRKLSKFAREKKAAKTLGIVMGVFIICWLPFFVLNLLSGICHNCIEQEELVIAIVSWLGWINSGMNPIIYVCWSKDFRKAFARILCFWQVEEMKERNRRAQRAKYAQYSGASSMVLAPASVTYTTVCQHDMYAM